MIVTQPILIVDDEPINLRVMAGILGTINDLHVMAATSGEEALSLAVATPPDVVLLDVMMPGIDGYSLCETLRANPRFSRTRIIMVSSKATTEERLKGYQAGADDYIVKPFVPDELVAKVKVYAKLASAEAALLQLNMSLEDKVRLRTEQLVSAQRSSFLGAHAAEIVHNLNNPLAVVLGNLRILAEDYPDNPRVGNANRALEKMCDIIKTILQANKRDDMEIQDIDLNQIIGDEMALLEVSSFSSSGIKMKRDFGILPTVKGEPVHFAQSFANLLRNAADAMHSAQKKELLVTSRHIEQFIEIRISDTGSGISEDNLKRIFDPFFTTKPTEAVDGEPVGNGLGLPSVKRMLKAVGASIDFTSALGVGTTALVRVPIQTKTAAVIKPALDQKPSQPAPLPVDEALRQKALEALGILNTPREQIFDDLTLLASTICQTPMSAISLIDGDRQWFKATVGLGDVTEISRDSAFCAHTILGREPFVVEDTLLDERFATNPAVVGSPNIRFYAAVPISISSGPGRGSATGSAIGALCVMDEVPRTFNSQHMECLKALSRQLVAHLLKDRN